MLPQTLPIAPFDLCSIVQEASERWQELMVAPNLTFTRQVRLNLHRAEPCDWLPHSSPTLIAIDKSTFLCHIVKAVSKIALRTSGSRIVL
jgi:hypothetical protein